MSWPSDVFTGCVLCCGQPISDEDCADSLHSAIGKRKSLLENLLLLLNTATDLGVGPSVAELGSRPEEVITVRGIEHELVFICLVCRLAIWPLFGVVL